MFVYEKKPIWESVSPRPFFSCFMLEPPFCGFPPGRLPLLPALMSREERGKRNCKLQCV